MVRVQDPPLGGLRLEDGRQYARPTSGKRGCVINSVATISACQLCSYVSNASTNSGRERGRAFWRTASLGSATPSRECRAWSHYGHTETRTLARGVGIIVDGSAYVLVDGRPEPFPVLSDQLYVLNGQDVHVLTNTSYKWRQYYMVPSAGWTSPETFSAVARGAFDPTRTDWYRSWRNPGTRLQSFPMKSSLTVADEARPDTAAEEGQEPRPPTGREILTSGPFHVAAWSAACLVVWTLSLSTPIGAPARGTMDTLLWLACLGWAVNLGVALLERTLRRHR